jgi:hypothetical protein
MKIFCAAANMATYVFIYVPPYLFAFFPVFAFLLVSSSGLKGISIWKDATFSQVKLYLALKWIQQNIPQYYL